MTTGGASKIIIRHLSGSKANQIEDFALGEHREIRLGRDAGAHVIYDPARDDVVSRSHAVITIAGEPANPSFSIADLNSSNGTFVNQKPVKEKTELLPDDVVTLGRNGPSFKFDVQPRPAALGARTRVIDAVELDATRVLAAAGATTTVAAAPNGATSTSSAAAGMRAGSTTTQADASRDQTQKEAVGKGTLLGILEGERAAQDVQRKAMFRNVAIGFAGLALVIAVVGGLLYTKGIKSEEEQQKSLQALKDDAAETRVKNSDAVAGISNQIGKTPQQISQAYGDSTAKIHVLWGLFDKDTGRPIFHKTFKYTHGGETKPFKLYLKLSNGEISPWLTLDDDDRTNERISMEMSGSAFVVGQQGFMLTNKHIVAAWAVPYGAPTGSIALLLEPTGKKKGGVKVRVINLDDDEFRELKKWTPQSGGRIFNAQSPKVIGSFNIPDPNLNQRHNFEGRNEVLEVYFPGDKQRYAINGSLVRVSNDADVALIKVDAPRTLEPTELMPEEDAQRLSAGERVVVLGYPTVAATTYRISDTVQNGKYISNTEEVLKPFVTDGIVAVVSTKVQSEHGVKMYGADGDVIQLTINSTGKGNSGGPVFNSEGKVIGIFSTLFDYGQARNSAAVPIKYGQELLR